jgi:hypothetical protein
VYGRHLGLGAFGKALVEDAVFLRRIGVPARDAHAQQALQLAPGIRLVIDAGAAPAGGVLQLVVLGLLRGTVHACDVAVEAVLGKDEMRTRRRGRFLAHGADTS